jgi:hypothetical protein
VRLPSRLEVAIDFAAIAGFFITIAGLWYSVKAWHGAIAAEKAANEARDAVLRNTAADELQHLAGLAKELLACVQDEQFQSAALRGRDLVAGIHHASLRWRAQFPSGEVEQRLEKIGTEVEKISKALSSRKGQITAAERERVLSFCHNALRILSGEAGRMASHVEVRSSGR